MKKIKFITHTELHRRLMKNPGFKKAYNDLKSEFSAINARIDAHTKLSEDQCHSSLC